MKTVLANGVFDVPVHIGHLRLLQWARSHGDYLVVAINSDVSAWLLKGPGRPIVTADERREILVALRCVDDVFIFDEPTPERVIREIRPMVLVKGPAERGREIPGAAFVESYGGTVAIPDWPIEHSTTSMIERCKRA